MKATRNIFFGQCLVAIWGLSVFGGFISVEVIKAGEETAMRRRPLNSDVRANTPSDGEAVSIPAPPVPVPAVPAGMLVPTLTTIPRYGANDDSSALSSSMLPLPSAISDEVESAEGAPPPPPPLPSESGDGEDRPVGGEGEAVAMPDVRMEKPASPSSSATGRSGRTSFSGEGVASTSSNSMSSVVTQKDGESDVPSPDGDTPGDPPALKARTRPLPPTEVPVTVSWYGHACFAVTYSFPGHRPYTVAVDPYGAGLGYPAPALSADALFVTHEHADHNFVDAVTPNARVWTDPHEGAPLRPKDDGDGEDVFSLWPSLHRSLLLRGLAWLDRPAPSSSRRCGVDMVRAGPDEGGTSYGEGRLLTDVIRGRHYAEPHEAARGDTAMLVWRPVFSAGEGARFVDGAGGGGRAASPVIAHLGDVGQDVLSDEQIRWIVKGSDAGFPEGAPGLDKDDAAESGGLDILMIPVGGVFTLDAERAARIVAALNPRVVVPMHYQTPLLDLGEFALSPVEDFLAKLPPAYTVRRLDGGVFSWPIPELAENDRARRENPDTPCKRLMLVLDWKAALTHGRPSLSRATPEGGSPLDLLAAPEGP